MYPNETLPTLATLTAASAGASLSDLSNRFHRGVQLGVNITAITGASATLTVIVEGYDAASNSYYTLLSSAGLTATGFTLLTVCPGVTATANVSAAMLVPRTFRIRYTITGTTPAVTATIGGHLAI